MVRLQRLRRSTGLPLSPTACHASLRCACRGAPTYDVQPSALEARYKRLQWNLHPDRVTTRPPQEREYSATQASLVNRAYSVLKSPLARANYIVRHGLPA